MNALQKIDILIEEAEAEAKAKDEASLGSKLATGAGVAGGGLLAAKKLGGAATLAKNGALLAKLAKAGGGAQYVDPSKSRWEAAKHSALASGIGTALVNSPGLIMGDVPGAAVGIASGIAAGEGGLLGAAIGGGRDTYAKSALIPAAVVAGAAPLTDMAMNAAGLDSEIDATTSAALTAGLGSAGWLYRNWNKKKEYV